MNSGFIPLSKSDIAILNLPDNKKYFLAIIHKVDFHPYSYRDARVGIYTNKFIIIGSDYRTILISEDYTFGVNNHSTRINYPTTIIDNGHFYSIPFGEMDCESFLARVDKVKLLKSMVPAA